MEAAMKNEPMMMIGSEGHADYYVFARKGSIALGVKVVGIIKGQFPGTTYISARVRSAVHPEFASEKSDNNVVSLAKLTPESAWPDVVWQKSNASRASTIIGAHLQGKPSDNPNFLLEEIEKGEFIENMVQYMAQLAGAENLIASQDEIKEWLLGQFKPVADKIRQKVELVKEVESDLSKSIGVFGTQAAILKKAHDKLAQHEGVEDLDLPDFAAEDEDENEDDEPNQD